MTWPFRDEAEVLEALGQQFEFPDCYLVLDTETCGFSPTKDVMVDLGWAVIRDRQIVNQDNLLLNWSAYPGVDHGYIQRQLLLLERKYGEIGRPFYYPWERLCDEGIPPLEAIHTYTTLIYEHIQRDEQIVGHGFWRFDRNMIDAHTQRFLSGYLLPWRLNSIIDTGLMEKAAQANRPPYDNDTLDEWFQRINNANIKGVKWNLENHCVPKYRLVERFNVDMRLMHTAGFDCTLIHYLMETLRQLTEVLSGEKEEIEDHSRPGPVADGEAGSDQGPEGLCGPPSSSAGAV
jgi:hypothetical protein